MQHQRCQSPKFAFISKKKFRTFIAVILVCLMLAPESLLAQVQTYNCPTAFGPVPIAPVLPAVLLQSLKTVANPILPNGASGIIRDDLKTYIANQAAAIQLGTALLWDMQAGSDNKPACAPCHFKAGQDGRDRN